MSPRLGGPVNAVRHRRANMFSANIGARLLGLAHEAVTSQNTIKVASIVVKLRRSRPSEGAYTDSLIEHIAALGRCIDGNRPGWGCLRDLQNECNILRTTLWILSWYPVWKCLLMG